MVTSYGYDGNGNQTSSTGPAGAITNTFNAQDQLVRQRGPGTDLSLVYDGQGDRLRSVEAGGPLPVRRDEARDLVGGLSSLAGDGQADYAYLAPGSGMAPLSTFNTGVNRTTSLGTDLLGSVRLATDPTGATIGAGAYDAWGNARAYAGPDGATRLAGLQAAVPFGYAGQQYDAGPGTYAMRARTYDPGQGAFLSADPHQPDDSLPITANPYEYAGQQPTSITDPSGQWWVPAGDYPGAGGNQEQQAEDSIIASFYQPPPVLPNAQGLVSPTPKGVAVLPLAVVPVGVLYDVPVQLWATCAQQHLGLGMVNILDTASHQLWDIEEAGHYASNRSLINAGLDTLQRTLRQRGYALPRNLSTAAGDYKGACGEGIYLLDCYHHPDRLGPPLPDPGMRLGDASIDTWFTAAGAAGDAEPTATPGPAGQGGVGPAAHHRVPYNFGHGSYEWWVERPGLILWKIDGEAPEDRTPYHYTNGVLNVIDLVLGGHLVGGQMCADIVGCGVSAAWLATDLDFAKSASVALVRGSLRAGQLGVRGMQAGVRGRTLVLRIAQSPGEHLLAGGKRVVEYVGNQAERFLAKLGCRVRCFPAGTRVATPHGATAIERLHVGDLVLSEDPASGKVEPEAVQAVLARPAAPLLALDLSDGSSLAVQPNHYFWVDGGPGIARATWLQAGELRPGDRLRTADGHGATVLRVRWNQGEARVYTLTVATHHTFFVGAARVLVHNADGQLPDCDPFAVVPYGARDAANNTVDGIQYQYHHALNDNWMIKVFGDLGYKSKKAYTIVLRRVDYHQPTFGVLTRWRWESPVVGVSDWPNVSVDRVLDLTNRMNDEIRSAISSTNTSEVELWDNALSQYWKDMRKYLMENVKPKDNTVQASVLNELLRKLPK